MGMRRQKEPKSVRRDRYQDELRKAQGLTPTVPEEVWRERLDRIQKLMAKRGYDALLIYGSPHKPNWVRYLANYVHPIPVAYSLLVLRLSKPPVLLIDRPWFLDTAREMSWIEDIRTFPYVEFQWQQRELTKLFRNLFRRAETLGIVEGDLPSLYGKVLGEALSTTRIKDITGLLFDFVAAKTDYDKEMIRQTARNSDAGMTAALRACREGVPEYDVGLKAQRAMVSRGAEVGVCTVRTHLYVASSSRVMSNVRPFDYTGRKLEKGDLFFIDLTSSYMGYYADMCRTVSIGKPSRKQKDLFRVVEETYQALLDAMRPGVTGEELYNLAVKVAKKSGYEKFINHVWLGHGTGIINSEPPFMHQGEHRPYQAGTFANIEPGLFVEGVGGASVEDMLYVTENGTEVVNRCERELKIG